MKNIIPILVLSIFTCFTSAVLAERELEIEFRLHPDSSGGKTRNQGLEIDGNDAETYIDGDQQKLDTSDIDFEQLLQLVADSVDTFELIEGSKVRVPYVEVKLEFKGEDREIEVSHRYPQGQVPKELVELQQRYLQETWK